jgi:cytochrome c553
MTKEKPMTFIIRCARTPALPTLAGGSSARKEQADGIPQQATVEVAPPSADMAAGTVGNADARNTDDATLYAGTCARYQGATAQGVGGFPSRASLSRELVQCRLEAYWAGESAGHPSAVVQPIAKQLRDAQIAAPASYLGS